MKKITQITSADKRLLYKESANEKKMYIYPGDGDNEYFKQNQNILPNYLETVTFGEKLVNAITSTIASKKVDDKDCYVITGTHNSNIVYDENVIGFDIYVEKATGIVLKTVETINNNGNKEVKEKKFETKFDIVSDDDIAELDATQYILQETNK